MAGRPGRPTLSGQVIGALPPNLAMIILNSYRYGDKREVRGAMPATRLEIRPNSLMI
jgi:hypothetical protein